ncbi:hypothetical protein [Phenylobacterium montanum]|uniref:Uncharacterized protein n=1 Tax=Phenylobacterium montanum TaxID=2823693 RepID=A0A975FZI5_9CAUL|nr:hypothetical protein [Caulobacter sp. S6]QUD88363.1 hypothetical protein KCG34_00255 [Caulobacter sp. S6]
MTFVYYLIVAAVPAAAVTFALVTGKILNFNSGLSSTRFIKREDQPFSYWWRVGFLTLVAGGALTFGVMHALQYS